MLSISENFLRVSSVVLPGGLESVVTMARHGRKENEEHGRSRRAERHHNSEDRNGGAVSRDGGSRGGRGGGGGDERSTGARGRTRSVEHSTR